MRKSKRALALIMAFAMSTAVWGCGSNNDNSASSNKASEEPAASAEGGDTAEASNEKFYVYSWNTELESRLQFFKDANPELGKRIEYVNIGDSTIYQEKIDGLLAQPDSEEYPDLFAAEADYIKKYVNSAYGANCSPFAYLSLIFDISSEPMSPTLIFVTADPAAVPKFAPAR